ncbi:MAG: hypothetical protein ACI82A_003131 [Candidatus Azotimanducaceae bacterium]|jgi:hypothetical protein
MKTSGFTDSQILAILKQAAVLPGPEKSLVRASQTPVDHWRRWRKPMRLMPTSFQMAKAVS